MRTRLISGRRAWRLPALLAVLLLAPFLALRPSQAAPAQAAFGANVRINQTQTDQQQEPTLSVNPTNPQMVIAAAKDWRNGQKEVWHYRSTDGGLTWADTHIAGMPPGLPNQSDPVVMYDATGVAYTSIIGYNQDDFSKGGLFVARSTDNGATWSAPVLAAGNSQKIFHDKEWLTVDRSPTATRGTLYLTWTRFTTISPNLDQAEIMEESSTDGGATWSAPVRASSARQDNVQGSFPVVGPDGDLNVLYFDQTVNSQLMIARSTDRGRSFSAPVKIADVGAPPSPLPTSKFRMFVLPAMTINPVDGAFAVTWNDYTNNSDILLSTSRDQGRTWSRPVRVNQDNTKADQFFPTAMFGPDGVLHLAWLDRRDDPTNLTFSCYYTQSQDDGQTLSPNVRISDAQSDPSVGFGGTLIGDYIAVDAVAGKAWVAWVDTRTGDQNIYGVTVSGALDGAQTPVPAPSPSPAASTTPPPGATPAPSATATPAPSGEFVDPAFGRVWERSDRPVREGIAARPWMWGPAPFAAGNEAYQQGVNGSRLTQYFDKSRMEINNPSGDPNQKWYVTNGLLVVEMMTGKVQIGDNEFDGRGYAPNPFPVAGDPQSPDAPTYASLASVASLHGDNRAEDRTGQVVSGVIDHAGAVTPGAPPLAAASAVQYARYEPVLGHNIPNVFSNFMSQVGAIYQNGQRTQGPVVDPLFDLGYPITEAYWARLRIGGQDHWALIQAYQRRVLTYVPDNAAPWQVEMGNVGRHYYDWRYGAHSPYEEQRGERDDH